MWLLWFHGQVQLVGLLLVVWAGVALEPQVALNLGVQGHRATLRSVVRSEISGSVVKVTNEHGIFWVTWWMGLVAESQKSWIGTGYAGGMFLPSPQLRPQSVDLLLECFSRLPFSILTSTELLKPLT